MSMEYAVRKSTIGSRGIQPPNVRDDHLEGYPSKDYGNEESLRLRHLIFRFTEWFRPLISDVLSQEENLAKFEELAIEGVSEIVVSNVPSQVKNLSKFEEFSVEGVSEIVVSNSLTEELALEVVGEIVVHDVPAQEENLAMYEEITQERLSDIIVQQQNPSDPKHTESQGDDVEVGVDNIKHCEVGYLEPYNGTDDEFQETLVNVTTTQTQNAPVPLVSDSMEQSLDHQVVMDGNATPRKPGCRVSIVQKWFEPADEDTKIEQTVDNKNENVFTSCGSTILPSIPTIQQEDMCSNKQRDNRRKNDHHSIQYSNNNDHGEPLRLEENLAKFEELVQAGVAETVTPLALGGVRGSIQQPNQSIIQHTKVCEGDVEGHVEYPNVGYSDPDKDLDDEIEQIKVDAITMQRQETPLPLVPGNTDPNLDHQVLIDGNAIQIPSTCHLSMKQPLIELVDEETEMEQAAGYKNENLSATCGTSNEDSGIPRSPAVQQEEENRPSNKQR